MRHVSRRPRGLPIIGLRQFVRYFLGLGIWGFGGPIATVGYMQRDLVEKRSWLGRDEFLNGVALGQTMPGPLAAQVVMWIGYLQAGALGALATALPFIADHMQGWTTAFVDWVGSIYGPLFAKVGDLLGQLGNWISGSQLALSSEPLRKKSSSTVCRWLASAD